MLRRVGALLMVNAETSDNQYVICPHCEAKFGDCWEWVEEDVKVKKCYECGKEFRYWMEIEVTYCAEAL